MLARRAAERPEGVLQPFGERDIALAAEHHMGMLEARIGEPEVIEPVIERPPAMVTARSPMSVKSDRPMRPGSWTWRKMTSCSGPWRARQARIRRSRVRRIPVPSSGWRRIISSKRATGRSPGAAWSIGTISLSQTGERIGAPAPARAPLLRGQARVLVEPVGG